ncbi:hypothetical protein PG988_008144 [Apiospora saccharicola]
MSATSPSSPSSGSSEPVTPLPEFSCLRCESKGMKCDFTKFTFEQDLDPMCVRCVRAGAKFCIKQRLPRPGCGGDEGRVIYLDPRVGDDYDREEVLDMIDDFWRGPETYTFGGAMPVRAKEVRGWALPAAPRADRFAKYDKFEKKAETEPEPEPATPTKKGTAAAPPLTEEQLRKQREERRRKLTHSERNAEDWAESAAQSWGKVLPARINKSKTQIPLLQQTVAAKRAQHDLEWEALCAEFEKHGLRPPSPEEKPELETAETAILRAKLKHYQMRRTHLTEALEAKRPATKQ